MGNGLNEKQRKELKEVENYVSNVIPEMERVLADPWTSLPKKRELLPVYKEVLRVCAPWNFICFNKYLEFEDDHNDENKAFYHHRQYALAELFEALNDMEIYDKYDTLLVSLAPRTGKTTTGIRFLAWIIGRKPLKTQLATSYSDSITSSFYIGVMEIVSSDAFNEIFPDSPVVFQNAKREEIWLRTVRRYPSISFVSIGGSMTGRAEAGDYLYCDDMVSGLEEALSKTRLDKLWGLYTVNAKQRKKKNAKEIHVATRWSVHDPVSKLDRQLRDDPRTKIISIPWYNENGESLFDFLGGFDTNYYLQMKADMDSASFKALYECEPIEREGLLYPEDSLQYYMRLPNERPDTIIGICDSKNLGKDYVSALVGYVYGDIVYIEDVVYNSGLPEITRPLVANLWLRHNVVRADVEMNNGGNYYAEDLEKLIKKGNGKTSLRLFFSGNNKMTKIITYSDFVKKHFVFKDKSQYDKQSDYAKFMEAMTTWTQLGTSDHDDAPDSVAMLAQLVQDLTGNSVKILNRRELGV